jgi:hypothetical protein
MIEISQAAPPELDRFQRGALIVGIIGLVILGAGAFFSPDQFFRSYLMAYVFWVGVALGSFALLMVQHMSGGAWGLVIRRLLEGATRTFPLLAILFIPVALGVGFLYEWADPGKAHTPLLEHKRVYLNIPFFLGRAVFYFAVWIVVTYFLNKWSLEQDRMGHRPLTRKLQVLSGPGLILYGLTVTFMSVDWVMSLEPEWYSTIFGIIFMGGQGVSAMAMAIAALMLLSDRKPLSDIVRPAHFHDLGKLLLAFVMLWAYFNFSQFLIIWSGNLPEEVPWYVRRLQGGWQYVGLLLVVFHFALPFLLLLSRDFKRNARGLAALAIAVIVMRFVDLFWLIAPSFEYHHWFEYLLFIPAPIGLGGIWLAYFAWQLKQRPLIPVRDPYLEDALNPGSGH